MQSPRPRFGRLAPTLFSLGLLAVTSLADAQQASERSLAQATRDRVKTAASTAWQSAQDLSVFALGLIGIRYRFGGNTPETGLDCSGLVRYVFQQVTGIDLPRTAKEMSQVGEKVGLDELQPGDLVFFNTRRFAFSHVGIYLGDNRFIHAPSRGKEVELATIDKHFWQQRFNGARRLASAVPRLVPSLVTDANAATMTIGTAAEAAAAAAANDYRP
jgi:cell wall-associated NlpC family hydrolase